MKRVTMEQVQELVRDLNNELPKQAYAGGQEITVVDLAADGSKYQGDRYMIVTSASRIRVTSLFQCKQVLLNLLWAFRDGAMIRRTATAAARAEQSAHQMGGNNNDNKV